jgi:hypothetical protein
VRPLFADDLLSRLRVDLDRNLVSHGAARDEGRGFALENGRRALLEPVDRGIFAVNVVAHHGDLHCLAHFGRRLGYGVAAQVDHTCSPFSVVSSL